MGRPCPAADFQESYAHFSANHPYAPGILGQAGLRPAATLRHGSRRGTSHTATFLRAIGPEPWRAAYVQPSRRPKDGRYGENPNRLQHYYQYQVVLKPAPPEILDLYIGSLKALGIDPAEHDIRFVEDDWEIPRSAPGAWAGKSGSTAWK